jgi:hypothetical protein
MWSEAGLAFEASSASMDLQQQQPQQQQQEGEASDADWVPREQHDKLKRKLETAKVCCEGGCMFVQQTYTTAWFVCVLWGKGCVRLRGATREGEVADAYSPAYVVDA